MTPRSTAWLLLGAALGCSGPATQTPENPGVAFPTSLGEGTGESEPRAPASESPPVAESARAPDAPPESEASERRRKYGSLPDPVPLSLQSQWELTLRYDGGRLSLGAARRRSFDLPVTTPRRMGRFAVELWIGNELIDRVRFDFPLVVDPEPPSQQRDLNEPVRFDPGTKSTHTLLVPDSPRATRALIVDRASGTEIPLPWPPDRPLGPEPAVTLAP